MKADGYAATFGRRRTSYPRLLRRRTRVVRLDACWSRNASPSSWKGMVLASMWNTATRILCAMAMVARCAPRRAFSRWLLVVAALGPGGAGLNGLEVDVALAGHRALFLSGALVIAGADPGPRGQAPGVVEHGHVNADLRDDRQRDPVVDTGDLPEQLALRRVGLLLNALVQGAQIRLDRLDPPEVESQQVAVMLGQPAVQRQGLQLAAQLPPRQVRHLLRRGGVLDQRLQHRPAGDAKHLADHAGQLDVPAA